MALLAGAAVTRGFILRHGLRPGYELGGSAAEVLVPAPASPTEGLRELEASVRRLQAEPRRLARHPVLGAFTCQEWDQYHLRHAELHLSFLMPAASEAEGRHES